MSYEETFSSRFQDELLSVVAKHPAVQRRILLELARDLQFRKRLLKVVGRIPKHT